MVFIAMRARLWRRLIKQVNFVCLFVDQSRTQFSVRINCSISTDIATFSNTQTDPEVLVSAYSSIWNLDMTGYTWDWDQKIISRYVVCHLGCIEVIELNQLSLSQNNSGDWPLHCAGEKRHLEGSPADATHGGDGEEERRQGHVLPWIEGASDLRLN